MQRSADEGRECPGLDHPGQNKKERPNPNDTKCGGRSPDAPDWNIRGRTSSRGCRPLDWIIRGQAAARRHGLDHPGRKKQQDRRPPDCSIQGQEAEDAKDGIVRGITGRSGHNHRTGSSGEKRRDPQGRIVRGGTSSTSPDPPDRTGRSTKYDAKEEQRHRAVHEAEEMQSSKDEAGPRGSGAAGQKVRPR